MFYDDTIIAPATVPGTGAISILRISGPDTFRIVDAVVQLKHGTVSKFNGYTIHYGTIATADGAFLDEVLVSVFRAPNSYTGEDSAEVSCHASAYIASEAVQLFLKAGCRMAGPGEFTQRAFLNGKMDLAQAEAVADVISSTTESSHRIAVHQLRGGISQELQALRDQMVEMTSLLELELDFSEEDVEFADRSRLLDLIDRTHAHVTALAGSFRLGNAIKNGVPVAIVGAANAGKSTLLNTLLGEERAIVSDLAGTTRDTIEETLNLDGILFRFIDTAGIRETSETIERIGIERTYKKISEAEIVLALLDVVADESNLLNNLRTILSRIDLPDQKVIILLNKVDMMDEKALNKNVIAINNFVSTVENKIDVLKISAKTGTGADVLKKTLFDHERSRITDADSTLITNYRHFEALQQTARFLAEARAALTSGIPADLVAEDLRRAISAINTILGTDLISPDTILHTVFSKHCIGK